MDIENMHPFCLPFGFCHDATSSSIAADFTSSLHSSNNNNNNTSNNNDYIKDKIRSKTSSPSDELFRHLNNATSTSSAVTCQSLLNDHDLIIGSTSSLQDITNDEHSFYSLELDADIETDSTNCENDDRDLIDSDIVGCFATSDDDLKITSNVDDWFCSSQFSLFSPINSNNNTSIDNCLNNRRKSLIKSALLNGGTIHSGATSQNHVFQHVVDPIDIKSSPTLAQLNLNSNDDPTDGFWNSPTTPNVAASATGTVSATTPTTLSSSTSTSVATNSDLLTSNSTSINNHHLHHHHHHHHQQQQHQTSSSPLNGVDNSINLNCDHLQHNHTPNNHHLIPSPTSTSSYSSAHLNSISSCHHVHHRHHHQHQGRFSSSAAQSTCLAVTPFRRPVDLGHQRHQYSPCCQNLLTTTTHLNSNLLDRNTSINSNTNSNNHDCSNNSANNGSNNNNNGSNLKLSITLNQLNQQLNHQSSPVNPPVVLPTSPSFRQLATIDKSENQQNKSNQQQQQQQQPRSASPALVTSSSSPLLSSLNQAGGENRFIDNKLKENIEYLTALLCNGNKLDIDHSNNINQQATISSTIARSYTTLAQSLSTGPKLLEKQQTTQMAQFNANAQQKMLGQPNIQIMTSNLTNEAAPCNIEANHQNFHQAQAQAHNQQQQHQAQQQQQQQQAANPLKRPYPTDLWFKSNVESSVSAADSTESQVSSLTNSVPDLSNNGITICPTGKLVPCGHNQQMSNSPQATIIDQRQKPSELKVLSSLLNANKCPTNQNVDCNGSSNWQQNNANCVQQQQQQQQAATIAKQVAQVPVVANTSGPNLIDQQQQSSKANSDPSSIPVNGKPITLKPVGQNNLIIQQQQRARHSAALFAQPASPSASASSTGGNNADVCSASSISVVVPPTNKRQRQTQSSNNGKGATTTNNRSNRPNSMSTDCSLSSHDEGFSSQVDIDDGSSTRAGDSDDEDDDVDSDDESFYGDYTNSDLIGASISDNAENKWTLNMGRTRRNGQKRFFWQYNVQSKGPKGTRICSTDDSEDPFVLPEASDPVFSNDCRVEGVKHSGKARRGDGNDLTPNPRKLLMIGLELKKLGKIINDLAPVTNLPMNARNKTRKEKNKLASRACRLKKKAQHEANKIKLYGLQREHQQVVKAIYDIRKLLNETLLERDLKDLKQKDRQQDTFNGENGQQESKTSTTITTLPTTSSNNNATTNSSTTTAQPLPTTATTTSSSSNNNNTNGNICYGNVSESVKTIAEQCSMTVAGQASDYVNSVLEKVVSGCIDGGLQT